MRVFCAALMLGTVLTGAAQASSLQVLAPIKETVSPSILVLGASATAMPARTAAAKPTEAVATPVARSAPLASGPKSEQPEWTASQPAVTISPSIVAMGEPAPGISYDKVAAISDKTEGPKHGPLTAPMVIRGGVIGDAFVPSVSAATPVSAQPQEVANESPSKAAGTASGREKPRKPEPPSPPPVAAAPAPPTRAPR